MEGIKNLTQTLSEKIFSRKSLISLGLMSSIAISGSLMFKTGSSIKEATILQGGFQTCFARVNQTYTAKMLVDKSSIYLDNSFMQASEECFGEAKKMIESVFAKKLAVSNKKLNAFSSDLHWFHQRVEGRENSLSNSGGVVVSGLGSRFEKLENQVDEILASVDELLEDLNSAHADFRLATLLLGFLFTTMVIWDFVERRKGEKRDLESESDAYDSLKEEVFDTHVVERIISNALEGNKLIYCSRLFDRYKSEVKEKGDSLRSIVPLTAKSPQEMEAQIDKIWNETEGIDVDSISTQEEVANVTSYTPKEGVEAFNLVSVVDRTVDILSNKLQGQGIRVSIDIEEALNIYAKAEELEQVLYHVILNAATLSQQDDNIDVSISSKKLGGSVVLKIQDSGKGFSKELIRYQATLDENQLSDHVGIGLQISMEFMKEFDGSISFANRQKGGEVALVFKLAHEMKIEEEKSVVRVLDVQKGTKKEILERMRSDA